MNRKTIFIAASFFVFTFSPSGLGSPQDHFLDTVESVKKLFGSSKSFEDSSDKTEKYQSPEAYIPKYIEAKASADDPYFPRVMRPLTDSPLASKYSKKVINKVEARKTGQRNYIPWTFEHEVTDKIFELAKIVPDRIVDPNTNKEYIKLYHGTSDDLVKIFENGAAEIRFDVATNVLLGQGFYLAANLNEAKNYACSRALERRTKDPNIRGMVLVVGIDADSPILGKYSKDKHLSDNQTGEPLEEGLFFKRNHSRPNQFVFFKNVRPYLKIFELVVLPSHFGKSPKNNEGDGLPKGTFLNPDNAKGICVYN